MTTSDLSDNSVVLRPVDIRNISLLLSAGERYQCAALVRDGELVADKSTMETTRALVHWLSTTFPLAFPPPRQAPLTPATPNSAAEDPS
jgi:hypothetical protein